jgi:hypothetical protein
VAKVSAIFYACMLVSALVAGVLLWLLAGQLSIIDNIEQFMGEMLSVDDFQFAGSTMLRVAAIGGITVVVLGTLANVLLAVLYNLISDVVGGIELTLLEEQVPADAPVVAAAGTEPAPAPVGPPAPLVMTRDDIERAADPDPASVEENGYIAEGGTPGGAPERGEHRPPGDEHEDAVARRSWYVEAE